MTNLKRPERRRFENLMRKQYPLRYGEVLPLVLGRDKTTVYIGRGRLIHKDSVLECWELYQLGIRSGLSTDQIHLQWNIVFIQAQSQYSMVNQRPVISRKDNSLQTPKQYQYKPGEVANAKVRFPKKVRKTAWKRFKKIFGEPKQPQSAHQFRYSPKKK